jgi:hypothetical protein
MAAVSDDKQDHLRNMNSKGQNVTKWTVTT